jgi:prevent-host-death family protein
MESVDAREAKTHLPRLLEAVAAGESVVITKHGKWTPSCREESGAGFA